MIQAPLDVIRYNPDAAEGARRWGDRVMHPHGDGVDQPLSSLWNKPPVFMGRGVDTSLFAPSNRDRASADPFIIGFVGRSTVEKNVRFLVELEQDLLASGLANFRFQIIGQGALEPWLRQNLRHADFTGVLQREALARAYDTRRKNRFHRS